MLRKISLIIAAATMALAACAAESAADILKACAAKMAATPSVEFDMTMQSGGHQSRCNLCMQHDRYTVATDMGRTWYDGTTMWVYDTKTRELSVSEPTADELLQCNPMAIINGYKDLYTFRRVHNSEWKVELVARSATNPVRTAVLTVDPATKMPVRLDVTMDNGTRVAFNVVRTIAGKRRPDSTFKYDRVKYPAAEIIDLR